MDDFELVGQQAAQAALATALAATVAGTGGLLLLAGEAGAGKTKVLETCLADHALVSFRGAANQHATPPYGPIVAALRAVLRARPAALASSGPLAAYLHLLLPELGPPPSQSDPATLVEALCQGFAALGRETPTMITLDDLQWADNATLEALPALAAALAALPVLLVGVYRSDEVGRSHPLRRLRTELRRNRLLREIELGPLDPAETAALAAQILGQPPGPMLAALLYERTEGLPLFIAESVAMLRQRGLLRDSQHGLELAAHAELGVPETLRDTVLLRLDGLPESAHTLLHYAAIAGQVFDLAQISELAGETGASDILFERGLISETEPGRGVFRQALVREAILAEIPWLRRRAIHRQLAEYLQAQNGPALAIAQHWLAARQNDAARAALREAAQQACAIHAYRDAAQATQQVLELWPEGSEETQRLAMLDQLGECAQLCGQLADAAQAWRSVADAYRQHGNLLASAAAERKFANVTELQGRWEHALAAREAAARAFLACDLPAEAASDQLAAAAHLRSAGRYAASLALLERASAHASPVARPDLQARIQGLQGNVLARMGQHEHGLALVQQGLALALAHNQASAAAEIYQRLADSLEHSGDYTRARETYLAAFDFCQTNAVPATAQVCIACLTVVLRQTGEWDRAMTLCREVLASPASGGHARAVAGGMLGSLYAHRGQAQRAKNLLLEAAALAQQIELAAMELYTAWGRALLAELNGDQAEALEHCQMLLDRWQQIEDIHFVVPALRWIASFCAEHGAASATRACANALAQIAARTGQAEALSALAHTLGELALLDAAPAQALEQFQHALDLLHDLGLPYCHALSQRRAGVACVAAGQREAAIRHFSGAYRTARKLGARPLATSLAQHLEALGEPLAERLGRGAAERLHSAHLTRRQREILLRVAQGDTNTQIAQRLTLSPRTVEMHVANILALLDSRSRADAVRRAAELGLLE